MLSGQTNLETYLMHVPMISRNFYRKEIIQIEWPTLFLAPLQSDIRGPSSTTSVKRTELNDILPHKVITNKGHCLDFNFFRLRDSTIGASKKAPRLTQKVKYVLFNIFFPPRFITVHHGVWRKSHSDALVPARLERPGSAWREGKR